MFNILLESLSDLLSFSFYARYNRGRSEKEDLPEGEFVWETTFGTVCDIKTASQYKSNGTKHEGYIHIYKVEGRSKLYKDVKMFSRPKFAIGQTVRGYTKRYNCNVDSPKMGLFYLNCPFGKFF